MRPGGTWPDVDYASKNRSGWTTATHLRRLLPMAAAFRAEGHTLQGSAEVRDAVVRALRYWLAKDYRNPNWWWNRIGVPSAVADVCILMDDDIPADLRKALLTQIVSRSKLGMTGQNKVWVAGITLNRAVLQNDKPLMERAQKDILSEIRLTTREGVQPDYSFHQHGPQQQFGNYGLAYIHSGLNWGKAFAGTSLALNTKQREILSRYLLEGLSWTMWKGRLDISSCARQLSPNCQARKGSGVLSALRGMPAVDPSRRDQLVERLRQVGNEPEAPLIGNRFFWRSDMMVHRRTGFYASVKMSSKRVTGTETCNSENMKGRHLGDGICYIYRDGTEYDGVLPVWNWQRLPGLTAPQTKRSLVPSSKTQNRQTFVGGASDGTDGVVGMHYVREGLSARKSTFFCGDRMVCLGAGISYAGDGQVLTAVNQVLRRDAPSVTAEGVAVDPARDRPTFQTPASVQHDGILYQFPPGQELLLSVESREGTWKQIDHKQSDAAVKTDVVELCIDHGTTPNGASYAWIALPGQPEPAGEDQVRIITNTAAQQVVHFPQEKLLQAVLFEPGNVQIDGKTILGADTPCVAMLRQTANGVMLSVAEPTQTKQKLTITIPGQYTGTGCQSDEGSTTVNVELPEKGRAGSTVTLELTR